MILVTIHHEHTPLRKTGMVLGRGPLHYKYGVKMQVLAKMMVNHQTGLTIQYQQHKHGDMYKLENTTNNNY